MAKDCASRDGEGARGCSGQLQQAGERDHIGVTRGDLQACGAHRTDRDRDARLRRVGPVLGVHEASADLEESRLQVLHAQAVFDPWQAGVLMLAAHVPGSQSKLQPTVGENVDRRHDPR